MEAQAPGTGILTNVSQVSTAGQRTIVCKGLGGGNTDLPRGLWGMSSLGLWVKEAAVAGPEDCSSEGLGLSSWTVPFSPLPQLPHRTGPSRCAEGGVAPGAWLAEVRQPGEG